MTPEVSDLLTQLLTTLLTLLVVVAGIAARHLIRWLQARYGSETIANAFDVARIAVQAVEQMAASGVDLSLGIPEGKLNRALARARDLGERYGIRMTPDEWRPIIEAAVLELKATGREIKQSKGYPPGV